MVRARKKVTIQIFLLIFFFNEEREREREREVQKGVMQRDIYNLSGNQTPHFVQFFGGDGPVVIAVENLEQNVRHPQ